MSIPSTQWQERIAADEEQRYADAAHSMLEVHRGRNSLHGNGRALHRKQTAALRGSLTVHGDLPEFARQGLFANSGVHEAWVRCSNGGMDPEEDAKPGIRGFALKIFAVDGPAALGDAPAVTQDFLLIDHPTFAFAGSQEFVDFVVAAGAGKLALLWHLYRRYGLFKGLGVLIGMKKKFAAPFAGYANAPLFSAAPLACGPYAVRVRLLPDADNGPPDERASQGWGDDLVRRLQRRPLRWQLQLQPFVDEQSTPIEDATVDWPSAYTTVATLELPQQLPDDTFTRQVQEAAFDPWLALAAHRPLGDVMRARRVIYFASQQQRRAVVAGESARNAS